MASAVKDKQSIHYKCSAVSCRSFALTFDVTEHFVSKMEDAKI